MDIAQYYDKTYYQRYSLGGTLGRLLLLFPYLTPTLACSYAHSLSTGLVITVGMLGKERRRHDTQEVGGPVTEYGMLVFKRVRVFYKLTILWLRAHVVRHEMHGRTCTYDMLRHGCPVCSDMSP